MLLIRIHSQLGIVGYTFNPNTLLIPALKNVAKPDETQQEYAIDKACCSPAASFSLAAVSKQENCEIDPYFCLVPWHIG